MTTVAICTMVGPIQEGARLNSERSKQSDGRQNMQVETARWHNLASKSPGDPQVERNDLGEGNA